MKIQIIKKGSKYLVSDSREAQFLKSKGFGREISREVLELSVFEVLYLLEKEKVEVKDYTFERILGLKNTNLVSYLVYKDLKSKGYRVESGLKFGSIFRVYQKGHLTDDHSLWLVHPTHESEKLSIQSFSAKNRVAHTTRKKLLFAIVDDSEGITYLEVSWRRM